MATFPGMVRICRLHHHGLCQRLCGFPPRELEDFDVSLLVYDGWGISGSVPWLEDNQKD